jgi:hypothetical protein
MLLPDMDVTVQPHVNNQGLNLATIQLIIPNKQVSGDTGGSADTCKICVHLE